ncbi:ABC transporter ATP-binding protein [Fusibacter ferrireducens]|uniref:ABC transporter ATP-binding protein n=1 Tax=Fusibacter ferrireducens TaxID=2785058 RepID=A0ABR9ZWV7_9FIRM|nr:ABC transporter ATP-binding protein [Fusibacter ferrireducens]MBF4694955.1 ABC transporter ATP-binding protein [Fusibacter ferrireducens]
MKVLEVNHLETSFAIKKNKFLAIRDVSLHVDEGEILGIVGESGSGKSVTMKSVVGILPSNGQVESGEILFRGTNLLQIKPEEKRALLGNDITMIFQDPMTALNPLKTIGYHIEEIIIRHQKVDRVSARKQAEAILNIVEIPDAKRRLTQYPHEFSGGMRQRVVIGMALVNSPQLLIADEPTTALDVTIQFQILKLIKKLQAKNKMAVVLITHDLAVVYNMCHRILVMYGGKILEEGTRTEIFDNPQHPYTLALMESIPNLESAEKSKLEPIEGIAPTLDNMPAGCPFAPRCKHAMAICGHEMPTKHTFSKTHSSYCHLNGSNPAHGGSDA